MFNGELDFSTFSYRMQEMETRVRTVSAIAIGEQKADLLQGEAGGPDEARGIAAGSACTQGLMIAIRSGW